MSISSIHLKYVVIPNNIEAIKDAFLLSKHLIARSLYLNITDIYDNAKGKKTYSVFIAKNIAYNSSHFSFWEMSQCVPTFKRDRFVNFLW